MSISVSVATYWVADTVAVPNMGWANCNKLLAKGGKMFFRVNPGIQHKNGPWVEVFEWSFEVAHNFAKEFELELETFKQDSNDRKYFVFSKPA